MLYSHTGAYEYKAVCMYGLVGPPDTAVYNVYSIYMPYVYWNAYMSVSFIR